MAPKLNENRVPSKCLPLFLVDLKPSSLLLFILYAYGQSRSMPKAATLCWLPSGGGINHEVGQKLPGFHRAFAICCLLGFLGGGGGMDLLYLPRGKVTGFFDHHKLGRIRSRSTHLMQFVLHQFHKRLKFEWTKNKFTDALVKFCWHWYPMHSNI